LLIGRINLQATCKRNVSSRQDRRCFLGEVNFMLFRIGLAIAGMFILSIANAAIADDAVVQPNPLPLFFQVGVFTRHYKFDPRHDDQNHLVNLEYEIPESTMGKVGATLLGIAVFTNSYHQPCQYVYLGKIWNYNEAIYLKATAGLLHGYKGEFQHNIPANGTGTAPAIIPSLGVRHGRFSIEGIILGKAAFMLAVGARF